MSQEGYVQKKLAALAPPQVEFRGKVGFTISLKCDGGRIALTMAQDGAKGQDFIAINEDCVVEIKLDGDQLFFSKAMDAITTKQELTSFYGGLVYADYDRKLDRYKTVRFHARFNSGGKYGTIHAFNVNVDFLQGTDASGAPKWVALTIDPDIKNPPPIPG